VEFEDRLAALTWLVTGLVLSLESGFVGMSLMRFELEELFGRSSYPNEVMLIWVALLAKSSASSGLRRKEAEYGVATYADYLTAPPI